MTLCITCQNYSDTGCLAHEITKIEDGVKQSRARVCMRESKKVVR